MSAVSQSWQDDYERVEVQAYPEEWFHLHGKALSGLRHSHPLRPGEDRDEPSHDHEGEWDPAVAASAGDVDRRGVGAALYPRAGFWTIGPTGT